MKDKIIEILKYYQSFFESDDLIGGGMYVVDESNYENVAKDIINIVGEK